MTNLKIRQEILFSGLKYYEVAGALGVTPYTFSAWLRQELTGERLAQVQSAIDRLKEAKGVCANKH